MPDRDVETVRGALAGHQEAYAALVERHGTPVFNLLVRLVRDPAVAEELAQDTFLKAFSRLDTFDARRGFAPWLLRIAHNTGIDALRRRDPPAATLDPDRPLPSSAPGPDRAAEHRLLARDLAAALSRLRPEHRAALVLRVQEGQPYQQIAYVMGVSESTARSHVHRARRRLADEMRGAGWSGATNGPGSRSTDVNDP